MLGIIYGLIDGNTLELRYIGKTSKSTAQRLKQHKQGHSSNLHLNRWVAINHINIIILERNPEDLDEAEIRWIREMRGQGARLLNLTDGGGGIVSPSLETRAKMSAAKIGNQNSLGYKHTDAARAKMSIARTGHRYKRVGGLRIHSPETKAKISAALKGRFINSKTRIKMSIARIMYWKRQHESML